MDECVCVSVCLCIQIRTLKPNGSVAMSTNKKPIKSKPNGFDSKKMLHKTRIDNRSRHWVSEIRTKIFSFFRITLFGVSPLCVSTETSIRTMTILVANTWIHSNAITMDECDSWFIFSTWFFNGCVFSSAQIQSNQPFKMIAMRKISVEHLLKTKREKKQFSHHYLRM